MVKFSDFCFILLWLFCINKISSNFCYYFPKLRIVVVPLKFTVAITEAWNSITEWEELGYIAIVLEATVAEHTPTEELRSPT